jgi:hypothetical protein
MDFAWAFSQNPPSHFFTPPPNALVCEILEVGLKHGLRKRLTNVAAAVLVSLMSSLQDVHLSNGKDRRTMLNGAKFSTKAAYDTLQDK